MKFFGTISKLTSWIIPSKQCRILYKDFLISLDLKKDFVLVHENYERKLKNLQNKTDKIKVAFLIRENQKWTYQSLYEKLEKSEKFEPIILVSILELVSKGKDKIRNNLEKNYNFFKSKGMNVDYAYKDGSFVDLKKFNIDMLFYDQPWDLPNLHKPHNVSEFALTFYASYSYELIDNRQHYMSDFHKFLYKFFVDNELNLNRYESYMKGNSDNCIVTGYIKLDEYLKPSQECKIWKDKDKFKIIYAPHHSFEKKGIHFATFDKNGKFILELAKKHPETTWVFKPHPRFKYALVRNNIMTENEAEEYFEEWNKIGTVYDCGNYINLFQTSDLMITDSISFLAEYILSGHPIIRLLSSNHAKMNQIGDKINNVCYATRDNNELYKNFNNIINRIDEKAEDRTKLISTIYNKNESVYDKIYGCLLSFIGVNNES